MSKVENGQTVNVHYVGTLEDGTEFDSSRSRGETLEFQVGSGQMIAGFNNAVLGMQVGESKSVCLSPDEAYGKTNPEAVQTVSTELFPNDFSPVVGATVVGQDEQGGQLLARIEEFNDAEITLDFNHPMAGKTLNFEIELVGIS